MAEKKEYHRLLADTKKGETQSISSKLNVTKNEMNGETLHFSKQ